MKNRLRSAPSRRFIAFPPSRHRGLGSILPLVACGLLLFLIAPAAAGAAPATLTVRLDPRAIVAEGVSPHGKVLLFGVTVESRGFSDAIRRWDRVAEDDDGDGKVTFAFEREIPARSIWAVVELRGGDYVAITPQGPVVPLPLPPSAARPGAKDEIAGLDLTGTVAYVVIVRGNAGAWGLNVDANGRNDDDRTNTAVMRVDPSRLTSLAGNAPPPRVLVPGDLLLIINPLDMEIFATRLVR